MMREFLPRLRNNGMGIDYDLINYRFVDQWKDEELKKQQQLRQRQQQQQQKQRARR